MRARTITDDELDALLLASSPYGQRDDAVPDGMVTTSPAAAPRRPERRRLRWVAPAMAVASTAAVVVVALQAGALVGAPVTPAASATPDPVSVAYETWIADAEARATSGFERDVFADGAVTQDEYESAMDRFFGCLGARGLEVMPDRLGNGLITFSITGAGVDAAVADCATGTTELIEPLYSEMVQNPANRPGALDGVIAECLVEAGAVEAPYTAEDYRRDSGSLEFRRDMMEDSSAGDCFIAP